MKKLANTIFAHDQIFLFMQLLQSPDKNQCKKTGWARTSLEQRNKTLPGNIQTQKKSPPFTKTAIFKKLT
jgi:hypothetical protein